MASLQGFVQSIEQRKQQLDAFRASLEALLQAFKALPSDIAAEAKAVLAEEMSLVLLAPSAPFVAVGSNQDLVGKPALECVRTILAEHHNHPLHFSEIAKEAIRRGYKGRCEGNPHEVESRTINSFWAAMSRAEDVEAVGKGLYRLRTAMVPVSPRSDSQEPVLVKRDTWAARAAKLIKESGKPMTVRAIVDELRKRHPDNDRSDKTFVAIMYKALLRRTDLFEKTPSGFDLTTKHFTLV